jgi:hypothetical protein
MKRARGPSLYNVMLVTLLRCSRDISSRDVVAEIHNLLTGSLISSIIYISFLLNDILIDLLIIPDV